MDKPVVLPFINPATGVRFGEVRMHTPQEVGHALDELRVAARTWAEKPVQERVQIVRQLQAVMIDSLDEISDVLNQDCGKTRQDGLLEAFIVIDLLDQYLKRAARWLRRQPIPRNFFFFKNFYVEPRPYGVVSVIAPWNYPFALSMPPLLAALIAGNAVILKPSEVTAATGQLIENLIERVPELAPYVRVVYGDGSVGEALVQAGPDYIFLTGSSGTGQKVMRAAAERLIPVACELGGKGGMIILEDADLEAAAHWGVWGSFYNTGQFCISVETAYVCEQVYDQFVALAVEEAKKLQVGYTRDLESSIFIGSMTDPRQVRIIQRHLEDALEKGARALTGGVIRDMFVDPTILVEVDPSMLVLREETFGPLMPIMKVKDEEEALRLINASEYGLGGSVWGADLERAQRVAHRINAASIIVNDSLVQFTVPMLPFGGIKKSGYGRIHGKEGLMQFTRPYSFAVGNPPLPWDITTIIRIPGNYRLISALTRLAFGVTPRQRVEPVIELVKTQIKPPRKAAFGLGLLSVLGAAAGMAFALSRRKGSSKS